MKGKLVPPSPRFRVLDPTRYWECPSCLKQHVTTRAGVLTPMHECSSHKGMMVPFVQAFPGKLNPARHHHRVIPRGDYVNGEKGLRYVEGKPMMAVQTERVDGSHDTHVFPAKAQADQVK